MLYQVHSQLDSLSHKVRNVNFNNNLDIWNISQVHRISSSYLMNKWFRAEAEMKVFLVKKLSKKRQEHGVIS